MNSTNKKVIWAEGVFLGQQHFQQWECYHEQQAIRRYQLQNALAWGLATLVIDQEALLNAQFRIKQIEAIYPHGQLVRYQEVESTPLAVQLSVDPGAKLSVFLALPIDQSVVGITGYSNEGKVTAWEADYQHVMDLHDNHRQREVLLGRLKLQLHVGDAQEDNFHLLKIAEVINDGNTHYKLVPEFIPTVLNIDTVAALSDFVSRLLDVLAAKIRHLKQQRTQTSSAEHFLLLQALSSCYMRLTHLKNHPKKHPEQLFIIIAELASSLSGIDQHTDITHIPQYDHADFTNSFAELEKVALELLDSVMPLRMAALTFRKENDTLYVVDSIESSYLEKMRFFIAVSFQADDPAWISQFARQVKLGSYQAIDSIITSALPGVRVVHTQRPPNKLPVKTGYEYFYLEMVGDFWEQIKTDRSLGLFVPYDFVKADIELVTIQE